MPPTPSRRIWKLPDVTPVPKKKAVKELKKDPRPISLTPCISKVAEGFIVDDYVKPAVMSVIDDNQYEAIQIPPRLWPYLACYIIE